jgi:hypothetical protein
MLAAAISAMRARVARLALPMCGVMMTFGKL